jgi:hypothetical protein
LRESIDVVCPTNFSTSFILKFETAKYINKAKQAQEVLKRLQYYKQKNLLKPSSKQAQKTGQTEKEQQQKNKHPMHL